MYRRLPPLNAIKAFESAGRLGSFSAAAAELGVTHGAVSRQVRQLEDWFGAQLFRRTTRRVTLTSHGNAFLAEATASLDRLSMATERLMRGRANTRLKITVPDTLALKWLLTRIPDFTRRYPSIEPLLSATAAALDTLTEPFDVAIRRGDISRDGVRSIPFLAEASLPVMSPELLHRCPFRGPEDLVRHTVLHTRSIPRLWPDWLALNVGPVPQAANEMWFTSLMLALQSALDGIGIAIGPSALVAEDLASGRLVTPVATPVLEMEPFHVLCPPQSSNPSATDLAAWLFRDWLLMSDEERATASPAGGEVG